MEEIIRRDESKYIIIRKKGEEKEYYNGGIIYGYDKDKILRVSHAKWSKTFNPIHAVYRLDLAKDIIDGIRKYGRVKCNYTIAEIQTTTAIINYIEH